MDIDHYHDKYSIPNLYKPSRRQIDAYLEGNQPILLSGFTEEWKATKEWTKSLYAFDHQNKREKRKITSKTFAGDNFVQLFGNEMVSVTDCNSVLDKEKDKICFQMTVLEFLKINGWLIDRNSQVKDQSLNTDNISNTTSHSFVESSLTVQEQSLDPTSLYLKDWHLRRKYPEYQAYDIPSCIEEDWLNWWFDNKEILLTKFRESSYNNTFDCSIDSKQKDDFRFVYVGSSNTFTPLHHDVLFSYSWSVNIIGKKRWYLFPPEETSKLFDKENENLFTTKQILETINQQSVNFQQSDSLSLKYLYLEQDPGDILIVPSGWYHIVQNMEGSVFNKDEYDSSKNSRCSGPIISINHNWFNSSNILRVWKFLKDEVEEIRTMFEHHKESFHTLDGCYYWENHCEVVMKANTRINCYELTILLLMKGIEIKDQISESKTISQSKNYLDDEEDGEFILDTVLPRGLFRIQTILKELILSKSHPYQEHVRAYSLITEKQKEAFYEEKIISNVQALCEYNC